jgi:hypothetical protein
VNNIREQVVAVTPDSMVQERLAASFASAAGRLTESDDAHRVRNSVSALSLRCAGEARTLGAKHELSGAIPQGVMLAV